MKLTRKLRTLMVAAAAVFILAAPAYSWAHEQDHGWNHRTHYRSYSGGYAYGNYRHDNRLVWGDYAPRPWYPDRPRPGYWSEVPPPDYGPGIPFGFSLPGFSVYIGP